MKGRDVVVWAGASEEDRSEGVLYLIVEQPLSQDETEHTFIDAPIPGPLSIETERDHKLVVVSQSAGGRAIFDVEDRTWSSG